MFLAVTSKAIARSVFVGQSVGSQKICVNAWMRGCMHVCGCCFCAWTHPYILSSNVHSESWHACVEQCFSHPPICTRQVTSTLRVIFYPLSSPNRAVVGSLMRDTLSSVSQCRLETPTLIIWQNFCNWLHQVDSCQLPSGPVGFELGDEIMQYLMSSDQLSFRCYNEDNLKLLWRNCDHSHHACESLKKLSENIMLTVK